MQMPEWHAIWKNIFRKIRWMRSLCHIFIRQKRLLICEEMGLTGAIILILIFALLLWRLCVISMNCQELSGAMIAAGIMGHLAIQVILNIAVVTNTIPNTGITLPFISYGGTSIVFLLGEMGLALNVSRQKNNPPTR